MTAMTPPERFAALKEYSDRTGTYFGTVDRCVFFYSFVKSQRPTRIVELGTGMANTAMWMAAALVELGQGRLYVADGGYGWEAKHSMLEPEEIRPTHEEFFHALADKFGVSDVVEYRAGRFPPFPDFSKEYDLVFSDYAHGFDDVLKILAYYLPRMSRVSNIFIDSASSLSGSYLMLRELMRMFECGKVPELLLQRVHPRRRNRLIQLVQSSEFQLIPYTEACERSQNAMAWIRIQPLDLMPRPLSKYRIDSHKAMNNESVNGKLLPLPNLLSD